MKLITSAKFLVHCLQESIFLQLKVKSSYWKIFWALQKKLVFDVSVKVTWGFEAKFFESVRKVFFWDGYLESQMTMAVGSSDFGSLTGLHKVHGVKKSFYKHKKLQLGTSNWHWGFNKTKYVGFKTHTHTHTHIYNKSVYNY